MQGKIDFFFKDKLDWYYSWGYRDKDKNFFVQQLEELVKISFSLGNYEIEKFTQYGVKINVFITIPGINEKEGHFYKTWSNFMIFPEGKLKNNTLIGGKDK